MSPINNSGLMLLGASFAAAVAIKIASSCCSSPHRSNKFAPRSATAGSSLIVNAFLYSAAALAYSPAVSCFSPRRINTLNAMSRLRLSPSPVIRPDAGRFEDVKTGADTGAAAGAAAAGAAAEPCGSGASPASYSRRFFLFESA